MREPKSAQVCESGPSGRGTSWFSAAGKAEALSAGEMAELCIRCGSVWMTADAVRAAQVQLNPSNCSDILGFAVKRAAEQSIDASH